MQDEVGSLDNVIHMPVRKQRGKKKNRPLHAAPNNEFNDADGAAEF